MNTILERVTDSLYIAWVIARKDIVDALKNKSTRTNIILLMGLVAFFYWGLTVRPFDKRSDVVVYDEGSSGLEVDRAELEDGSVIAFYGASSLQEMERLMAYRDLGLVISADFDQILESGGEPTLAGYIFWVRRAKATELESEYAQKFSELVGQPVRVSIGENFVTPQSDALGAASTAAFHMLFAVFWLAFSVVPHLMFEERRTKTMDALLVSPASAGQVLLGKALAGMFYVVLSGGLALVLNAAYVTSWGLALLGFLASALFAIGLGLAVGSFVQSPQQLVLFAQPVVFALILPTFFAQEPNLAAGLKTVISWLPTVALTNIFGLSLSSGAPLAQLLRNLAIALGSTVLAYGVAIWKVRRSNR